ncbi:unnamed protein product [Brassicogethes aeneus]|uniref:DUF4371 domain-containing protein n=1 Tax=Brassicogethes aeneus TaxID=1431903 RepID=A0A9P0FEX4_BRAAE|nr:unnamed protein product [Brassicogethes aeneus]
MDKYVKKLKNSTGDQQNQPSTSTNVLDQGNKTSSEYSSSNEQLTEKRRKKPRRNIKKTLCKNEKLIKVGELKLAAFVAEHDISFKTMDHLPKFIKSICPDSEIAAGITCNRTKTTKLINECIGPYAKKQIVADLNEHFYSVIIDETTDISTKKCLAVLVRYFKNSKTVDAFLGLLELENNSTAASIYESLTNYLTSSEVNIEHMVGFAADNCATMMGHLNGVQALLKKRLPNLVVVGCSSHSFNLCSSYACAKIPKEVDELIKDIYAHFSHSSKRNNALKEFQVFCELKPHKILRLSETRWLSLQQVVDRVLEQYNALTLYFTETAYEASSAKINNILKELNNKITKIG